MSLKAEISMGSRLMEESLARGAPECISVRDVGWSSCRSRFLNSPDTLSCGETERIRKSKFS